MRQHSVSRSLSLPRTIGGAVRSLAIVNGTITALLIYATYAGGIWFMLGFFLCGCGMHLYLRWLTTRDPWWFANLGVYNHYGDVYDSIPWHGKLAARFRRPYGFDSDLPC